MVVIRLARKGAKKRPFYNIGVQDKRSKRDGRFIERVGYFIRDCTHKNILTQSTLAFRLELPQLCYAVSIKLQHEQKAEHHFEPSD